MPVGKKGPFSTLYIKGVPSGLHAAFAAHCALRRVSMTQKIIELLREVVKDTRMPGETKKPSL